MRSILRSALLLIGIYTFFSVVVQAQDIRVGIGQTKTVNGLKIKFDRVLEDSRCPVGTECIWEGNARISIKVTANRQKPRTIELNTNSGDKSVNIGGRIIELVSVSPERTAEKPIPSSVYRIRLRVTKG